MCPELIVIDYSDNLGRTQEDQNERWEVLPSDYTVVATFMVPYPQRSFKSGNLFCNTGDFGAETTAQFT